MGATQVSGRLPPEVIQRIVRQNFGRFRLCYENGLRNNPNLAGSRLGRASSSVATARSRTWRNGGSDLPDGGGRQLRGLGFYGLSFPQPEGGIVTVVYPIMFNPGLIRRCVGSAATAAPLGGVHLPSCECCPRRGTLRSKLWRYERVPCRARAMLARRTARTQEASTGIRGEKSVHLHARSSWPSSSMRLYFPRGRSAYALRHSACEPSGRRHKVC